MVALSLDSRFTPDPTDDAHIGNTFVPVWDGCPEPQLKKLGVSYT